MPDARYKLNRKDTIIFFRNKTKDMIFFIFYTYYNVGNIKMFQMDDFFSKT